MKEHQTNLSEEDQFRRVLKWVLLIGITVAFSSYFAYILYSVCCTNSWIATAMRDHAAVSIGIPFSALSALFIVLLLQFSSGDIEFKAPGFEFKGASGPIVLWLLCFLAIVIALKLLWF